MQFWSFAGAPWRAPWLLFRFGSICGCLHLSLIISVHVLVHWYFILILQLLIIFPFYGMIAPVCLSEVHPGGMLMGPRFGSGGLGYTSAEFLFTFLFATSYGCFVFPTWSPLDAINRHESSLRSLWSRAFPRRAWFGSFATARCLAPDNYVSNCLFAGPLGPDLGPGAPFFPGMSPGSQNFDSKTLSMMSLSLFRRPFRTKRWIRAGWNW